MDNVTYSRSGNTLVVQSPYNAALPSEAKKLGGRWNPDTKSWRFDVSKEAAVRALYENIYGGQEATYKSLGKVAAGNLLAGVPDLTQMTHEELLDMRVEQLVSKWGEGERQASISMERRKSRGLLANSIAHHDLENLNPVLVAQAKKMLTREDKKKLREGG